MKIVAGAVAIVVALAVASFVLAGLGASVMDLWDGAGFYALLALAFPAFVAWGAWKHGDRI